MDGVSIADRLAECPAYVVIVGLWYLPDQPGAVASPHRLTEA